MIPVTQTKISSPDGFISGNCFRACIASILEVGIDDIPVLEEMGNKWHLPFMKFLSDNGYEFEGTGRFGNEFHDNLFLKYEGVDGYIIVGGKSPREYVTRGHAVVYKDGKLAHDPHPSGEGVLQKEHYFMIIKKKDND